MQHSVVMHGDIECGGPLLVKFDYDVYIGEEKSPTSYLNNEVNVEFIDNTITTEQQ